MSDPEISLQEVRPAGPGAFPDALAVRELVDRVVAEARGAGVLPSFVLVIVGGANARGIAGGTSGIVAVTGAPTAAVAGGLRGIKLRVIAGECARILLTIRRGGA